jgi:hypothetical protein
MTLTDPSAVSRLVIFDRIISDYTVTGIYPAPMTGIGRCYDIIGNDVILDDSQCALSIDAAAIRGLPSIRDCEPG